MEKPVPSDRQTETISTMQQQRDRAMSKWPPSMVSDMKRPSPRTSNMRATRTRNSRDTQRNKHAPRSQAKSTDTPKTCTWTRATEDTLCYKKKNNVGMSWLESEILCQSRVSSAFGLPLNFFWAEVGAVGVGARHHTQPTHYFDIC